MRHAVIMAGGAGKRLWPLSRLSRPKQLLPLVNGKNLLELAVERLTGQFPPERIWIITNREYAPQVAEALHQLPPGNIIGEPVGRDTANAVALAAELLALQDPEGSMAVFTADHVIRPVERFNEAVEHAFQAAEEHKALVTFGIRPSWPHTGLGYIQISARQVGPAWDVAAFKEKPDHQTARRYVDSGRHFWNSGMFVWTIPVIREAMRQHLPASQTQLEAAVARAAEGDLAAELDAVYPQLEKISIDFALMEKARNVLMVDLGCEWIDVGSWPAMQQVAEADEAENVVMACSTVFLDSERNIVVCEDGHLVATVGMDDCIIVHAPDATLVCNRSDAQRIKELVDLVEERYGKRFV